MHRGEPVAADLAQDLGVEPGEAFEQAVEISPRPWSRSRWSISS